MKASVVRPIGGAIFLMASFALAAMIPCIANADAASEDREIVAYVAAEGESSRLAALEPGALDAAHGHVKRAGPILTFDLPDGPEGVRLEDRTECKSVTRSSDCQQFFLVAALPSRHSYIVVEGHYEGTDYILIDDRTGKGLVFPGPPQFAPRGDLILILSNNQLAKGPAIEIWERDAEGGAMPELIHRVSGKEAAATDRRAEANTPPQAMKLVRWAGDRIDLAMRYPAIYGRKPFTLRAKVERTDGAWQFAVIKPK